MVLRSLGCTSHDRQVTEVNAFYGVCSAPSIYLTVVKFRPVSGWRVHHPCRVKAIRHLMEGTHVSGEGPFIDGAP